MGAGGLPYFPFYFCSEQSLWVTFHRGGGWETRRGRCSLWQVGPRLPLGRRGDGGAGVEGGGARSLASLVLSLPAGPCRRPRPHQGHRNLLPVTSTKEDSWLA